MKFKIRIFSQHSRPDSLHIHVNPLTCLHDVVLPAPQERCRTTYTRGLSTTQRKQVLDYHNKLRSAVAGGRWDQ